MAQYAPQSPDPRQPSRYMITGVDARLKRFKPIYTNTPQHYNIYRGTCWERLPDGKRKRVFTWWN